MSAVKCIGTTLVKTKSGSEESDLTIADLTSIGEVGVESDEIDVTTLDSTGGYKEFIGGFKDAGEISLAGIIKSETAMEAMLSLAESQSVEKWTITTVNGATWTFNGFVKSFKEAEATVEGVRGFTGSIRISGAPEYKSPEASV
jgi:predicted secreted protein